MLTPTRELCIQVTQALRAYGARKGIDVVAVFGGAPIRTQQAQLRAGGQIVVGTVGRVLDLISAPLADPARLPLRRARRGRRDARPRLPRGRREDPLADARTAARPRCSARRCRRAIRKLADRYLYDPVTVKVKAATLTIDTVEQFHARGQAGRQGRQARRGARAPSAPTRRSSSCARRSAATSSTARCATSGMNVKALHGDMTQGARDGVMLAFKGGRAADPRGHRRRRPRPRHLDRHARRQLRRPDLARTSTCTASGAPAASGARAARSRSSSRARSASSRRSSATSARRSRRGAEGAHVDAGARSRSARAATPSRTSSRNGDEPLRQAHRRRRPRRRASRSPTSSTRSPSAAGLDGEAVRDVRVLERFSLPRGARAARPSASSTRVNGTPVNGTTLRLETAAHLSRRSSATAPRLSAFASVCATLDT